MLDAPSPPAAIGTHHLGGDLQLDYTAGRDYITEPLKRFLAHQHESLAVDIETYGLGHDSRRLKCVGVANSREVVVIDPRDPRQKHVLNKFFGHFQGRLFFHNSSFDVPNLAVNGLFDRNWCHKVWDTLIWARLAWPDVTTRKGLEDCAVRLLGMEKGEPITKAFRRIGLTIQEGYRQMDLSTPLYLMGNAVDAVTTARLIEPIRASAYATLTTNHPFGKNGVTGSEAERLVDREQYLNQGMLRRACKGIRVDLNFLQEYEEKTNEELYREEAILNANGIRPSNANDLIKVLERDDALPANYPRTPKTKRPSTTEKDLETLDHPLAFSFRTAKKITHIKKDYLDKCVDLADDNMRVHPVVNFLKATTGRMSAGDPPYQQFPGAARGAFMADEDDELTSIDWSQIEPVTMANVAGDLGLLAGYEAGTSDLYTDIATIAAIGRSTGKTVVLAQIYGEGLEKLGHDLSVDFLMATQLRDAVMGAMPEVAKLIRRLKNIGTTHRQIFTVSGRILPIPMGRSFEGRPPTPAAHKAVNYFAQGGAYDVLAEAMTAVNEAGLGDAMYLAMHDELVVSTSAAHDIAKIMRQPPERLCQLAKPAGRIPVLKVDMADLGVRWAAA